MFADSQFGFHIIPRSASYVKGRFLFPAFLCISSFAAAEAEEARPDTVTLSEVSVSAVKADRKLFESPVAASYVGTDELERLGAVDIKGISDVVPNFFMPDYGSRITSSIYVRGIGARMDQPAVGLIVDNVPVLNKDAYDFDIPDITGVEMLRGPQSTLFGRNTMGGIIKVSTLSPRRWQGWRFSAEGGNGNTWRASAGWYHKFSRQFGASATASYSYSDGFFRNEYNGEKTDKERRVGARVKLNWLPASGVSVQNTFFISVLRQGGYPYEYIPTGEISYNDTCFYRRFLLTDGLTLRINRDGYNITSVTSVQHINDNMTLDQDFLPESYFTLSQRKQETDFTEDLVFTSSDPDAKWKWLGGFFGFYRHLAMQAPVTFKDKGISSLIEDHRNEANPYYPVEWDSRVFPLDSDFTMPSRGLSLYHESKFDLGRWHLSAGLRLDYERVSMSYISSCHTGYNIMYQPSPDADRTLYRHVDVDIDDTGNLHRDFLTLLPRVTALYTLSEHFPANVYLNIAKGYKAGGFNTQMFSDVLQQRLMSIMGIGASYNVDDIVSYRPEQSWNFEVGAHLADNEGKMSGDVALFLIECRDQQLTMFPDGTTTGRIMTNAGKTRSFGGELSVHYNPIDNLSFTATYGYTNARFTHFFNGIRDFSGKYLPYVPGNTIFAQSVYRVPVRSSFLQALEFDVNVRCAGRIYWNEDNDQWQRLYARLGASVSLSGDNWKLMLWGQNLTNTRFHTFYFMSMGNEFLQRGKPIQFGATLSLSLEK